MAITARYGVGKYGQSYYGRVHVESSAELSFSDQSFLKGDRLGEGGTSIFISSSSILFGRGEISGTSIIDFDTDSTLQSSRLSSTSIVFSSDAKLIAEGARIYGSIEIEFSQDVFLHGLRYGQSQTEFSFSTQGTGFLFGHLYGDTSIEFSQDASPNRYRMYPEIVSIDFSSIVIPKFENSNPFLPTLNGGYIDLTANNSSSGYLDLLYVETSGPTNLPYKETVE